jgi:hypothetical protein
MSCRILVQARSRDPKEDCGRACSGQWPSNLIRANGDATWNYDASERACVSSSEQNLQTHLPMSNSLFKDRHRLSFFRR